MLKNRGAALALAALFVLGVYGVWLSPLPPPNQHTIEKNSYSAKNSSAYVAAPELAEDRIADYTWWLSAFTLALVVISVSQIFFLTRADKTARTAAEAAKKSAEVAERALIAGQRPFVSVTAPIIDGGLTWEEKGARTTILFSIKNVGKSPAFDISVQVDQFVMGRDKPDVNTELRKFCAAVRRQRLLPLAKGDVLFPNETLPQRHGLLFIRAEIETNAKCNGAFFAPIVLICVDYRSSVTERRHTTGLVYDLFQWTTEGAK
jgi:hypothetical protein